MRKFSAAREGNVAIIFALALIPLIVFVGAAIDFSRASAVRTGLQNALDATALMLSKQAASDTPAQLQANAKSYFMAQFVPQETSYGPTNVTVTANYSTSSSTSLEISASANVPTTFMSVIGHNSIPVGSSTTVKWGTSHLRVALVLDNTGSMAQSGKMTALKDAANSFLSQLQSDATNNGDIYVSVIPFAAAVNIGASNYAESWLDWSDYGNCTGSGRGGARSYTQALCAAARGTWKAYSSSQQGNWAGCVMDRGDETGPNSGAYDTNVELPTTSSTPTLYPAVNYSACPQQAMGQNYDWSAMSRLINKMKPKGTTNQDIGLQLGWMSLVGGGPFTAPPTISGYTYHYIIVLFTDGLNTQDRWYNDQASIDARQELTCKNIKVANIMLYTVQISTDGTPQSALLQKCASDSSKYFYLTSASQLVSTFNQIGTALGNLYVAK